MTKIYKVEVTFVEPVAADSRTEAEEIARSNARSFDSEPDLWATEITDAKGLGDMSGCCPWGGDGVRTCDEYLEGRSTPPAPIPKPVPAKFRGDDDD